MWIARDKDGSLWLFEYKPRNKRGIWVSDETIFEYSEVEINSGFHPFSEVTILVQGSPPSLVVGGIGRTNNL